MINPQMMGMGTGQLPNIPSVKELWKDEKEKYRHWMILFGIGIAIVFALLLTSIILNVTDKDNIIEQIKIALSSGDTIPKDPQASAEAVFKTSYIIVPSIQIALVGVGLLLFISTLIQSYQAKSFHKLSGWGTMVIGIGVFMSLYQLMSMLWQNTASFDTAGGTFQFVTYFVIIAVYFAGAMQVSKIRKMFTQAFRVEQMKNSPQYQQMKAQMDAMQNGNMGGAFGNGFSNGPFGPTMGTAQGATSQTAGPAQGATQAAPAKSSERIDLESMTVPDLKKVAKKLEISGYTTMKKQELVDAILRVTENN